MRDVSHEDTEAQSHDVEEVLRALGIDPDDEDRLIEVWNKIDRLDAEGRTRLQNLAERQPSGRRPVLVSAVTGRGRRSARSPRSRRGSAAAASCSISCSIRPTARA